MLRQLLGRAAAECTSTSGRTSGARAVWWSWQRGFASADGVQERPAQQHGAVTSPAGGPPRPAEGLPPFVRDDNNLLNEAFYMLQRGRAPLALGGDGEEQRRAARREAELGKQASAAAARVQKLDAAGRAFALGRRKEASARVWLTPGEGAAGIMVNSRPFGAYFPDVGVREHVLAPFVETGTLERFGVTALVAGGGLSGQAQALQLGIARALQAWDPELRMPLRAVGLLTRDPRVVERKKYGQKKARKQFAFVKR